jgi:hypothetical protein
MESYKKYFIDGSAMMTHPFRRDFYVCGDVFVQGPGYFNPGVRFNSSLWTSKNWRNGLGWRLRGL